MPADIRPYSMPDDISHELIAKLNQIKPDPKKALFFAKKQLDELVTDAVNLEGLSFTLPEVQTLLDGITVGGHKISDQNIVLNQAKAWHYLFNLIKQQEFTISKTIACEIHAIAADEEELIWGQFRTGSVKISGTTYKPPAAEFLDDLWQEMLFNIAPAHMQQLPAQIQQSPTKIQQLPSIITQACLLFLNMARMQFFYDVNKRTGRFMMNGLLLTHGYPVINVPAKRSLEFNQLMLDYYDSNNPAAMCKFLIDCYDPFILDIMAE